MISYFGFRMFDFGFAKKGERCFNIEHRSLNNEVGQPIKTATSSLKQLALD